MALEPRPGSETSRDADALNASRIMSRILTDSGSILSVLLSLLRPKGVRSSVRCDLSWGVPDKKAQPRSPRAEEVRVLRCFPPRRCVVCQKSGSELCAQCRHGSKPLRTPSNLPVSSLGPYAGQLKDWVKRLKYSQETALARPLGRALGQLPALQRDSTGCRLLPIPLHPRRLAERGYNQSALLARAAASICPLEVEFDALVRTDYVAPQAALSRRERQENVRHAFNVRPSAKDLSPMVLLDDVFTTGATLDAARFALEEAGAMVVGAVCVAAKL